MMKKITYVALLAVALLLASPLPGYAGSTRVFIGAHFNGGHGHPVNRAYWHHGWRGYPGWWGPGFYWGGTIVVPPPYTYAPPPAAVPQQPPAYAEPQQDQNYWYYCQNPQGYYPYVNSCPGGWMQVVPQPTPPSP
jgi:hypothetical protein